MALETWVNRSSGVPVLTLVRKVWVLAPRNVMTCSSRQMESHHTWDQVQCIQSCVKNSSCFVRWWFHEAAATRPGLWGCCAQVNYMMLVDDPVVQKPFGDIIFRLNLSQKLRDRAKVPTAWAVVIWVRLHKDKIRSAPYSAIRSTLLAITVLRCLLNEWLGGKSLKG